LNSFTVTVKDF